MLRIIYYIYMKSTYFELNENKYFIIQGQLFKGMPKKVSKRIFVISICILVLYCTCIYKKYVFYVLTIFINILNTLNKKCSHLNLQ